MKSIQNQTESGYVEFTENNDNEGEQWSFFVSKADPLVGDLKLCIEKYNKDCDEDTYSYRDIEEKEVKVLMKRKSKTSYMAEYNLCKIIDPVKVVEVGFAQMDENELMNYLYKGQCFKKNK